MNVTIEQIDELRLATVRHIGPYDQISEAFARLGQTAGPAGLFQAGTKMIAIYYDAPESTPAAELRSDAALSIPADLKLPATLGEAKIPAGRYARTLHVGPYSQLGDAWARLMGDWLPASEHRLGTGVTFEVYRNTPETAPPEKLETELYVPLA